MKKLLPNLGIIQALLQTLNEIFQNTKISTIVYSICVYMCIFVSVCVNWYPGANSVIEL